MMKYGTKRFLPRHMNSILVEAQYNFEVSGGNLITNIFVKTKLLLVIPTNFTTNTKVFVSSNQVFSGAKSEDINGV